MAAMSTKSTFALQFTGSEAENAMRKMVFAAAVGIQDGTLSNLAQPLVRIALKLFMLVLLALRWQVSAVTSSDKGSGPLRVFRVETHLSWMVARLVTS
jgi:hypothetical protein